MTCDLFVDAIGDLVDGTLEGEPRAELERHLTECADCRAMLAELKSIRTAASKLPRLNAPAGVWPRIERELTRGDGVRAPRPAVRRWRQALLAAAAVLILGTVGLLMRSPRSGIPAPIATRANRSASEGVTAPPEAASVEQELRLAEEHYEKAIAGLEAIAKSGQGSLDPQIASTLQKNLAVIDTAILESRAALQSQPTSQPAQESLFEAFRHKIVLLQETVTLINEMRKGNQAETARIVQGLQKQR